MFIANIPGVSDKSATYAPPHTPLSESLGLNVRSMGEFYCDGRYSTLRSGFNQYLLLYTLDGKGELRYKGKNHELCKDTLMVIDCNFEQLYRTGSDFWRFYYIHFDGNEADALYKTVTEEENFVFKIKDGARARLLLHSLLLSGNYSLPKDVMKGIRILTEIFEILLFEKTEEDSLSPIGKAMQYIRKNCSEKLSVKDIAREAFLSEFYFIRLFKRLTGSTPAEYIKACRISKAQIILKREDLSVEEVAERVGYENTSSFIRAFCSITGQTPKQFKRS